MSVEEHEALVQKFQEKLQQAQAEVKTTPTPFAGAQAFSGAWKDLSPQFSFEPVKTGMPREALEKVVVALTRVPEGFHAHPKLVRLLEQRHEEFAPGSSIDWPFAELLAIGSLLLEKTPVRLTGQDTRRGTFSQRHAVLYDSQTARPYVPLNHIERGQGRFWIYDSPLSEAAVLGFEFGYALDAPDMLVAWEAQFGDFANGAQVIIDQFIAASSSKWKRDTGLVMLLPHGYEGQGPEHSSARLERYLQLCADNNLQVCYPSTPSQYFHLLRRQMRRDFRRPLVVMTPKSMLRLKASPIEDLTAGSFREVLEDPASEAERAERVLLCSGKLYHELAEERGKAKAPVAIVRIEQLSPLHEALLRKVLQHYRKAREWTWVQEESQNMGAWTYLEPRLRAIVGQEVHYVGRDASASPATGSRTMHLREQQELLEAAIHGSGSHVVRASPH